MNIEVNKENINEKTVNSLTNEQLLDLYENINKMLDYLNSSIIEENNE